MKNKPQKLSRLKISHLSDKNSNITPECQQKDCTINQISFLWEWAICASCASAYYDT